MKRLFLAVVILSVLSVNAFAMETYSFYIFNDATYAANPNLKFFVDVDSYSATKVSFDIRNASTIDSVVKEIYFDDKEGNQSLLSVDQIFNHTGVTFSQYATPSELPGANILDPDFATTSGLSAEADNPSGLNKKGIDKGEHLLITFNLRSGKDYDDVIDYLDSKDLRIGLHIGSLPPCGDSVSAVNNGHPPVVPVPAAAVLAMIGFGCVTSLRRKLA